MSISSEEPGSGFDVGSEWQEVGSPVPAALVDARLQLHWAAQVVGADPTIDGAAGAYAILGQAGNLANVVVTVTTTTDSVIVDVTGTLDYSILGTYTVTARAEGPLERFIAEHDR